MNLPGQGMRVHKHFPTILKKLKVANPRILEVGSWVGESIIAWDRAANGECSLVCVDLWEPYFESTIEHYGKMNDALRSGDAYRLFKERTANAGLSDRLTIIKGDSRFVLPTIKDAFDVIYIDGCHKYEFVKSDILNSMTLLRDGGILCGDDLNQQISLKDIESHRSIAMQVEDMQSNYHAGVSQAIAEIFGHVACYDDLWVVQKLAEKWGAIEL